MELLRPILSKLELICQQPAISQWGGVQWGKPASSGTREDGWALQAVFWTWGYLVPVTQRAHSAVITSLWRRNHVTVAFWRHNHVISAWCVRWVIDFLFCTGEIYLLPWWLLISLQWVQNNIFLWTPGIFKFTLILQSRFFFCAGWPRAWCQHRTWSRRPRMREVGYCSGSAGATVVAHGVALPLYRDCFLDLRLFNSPDLRRLVLCYCCQAWTLETVLGGNTALPRWWTGRSIDADAKR